MLSQSIPEGAPGCLQVELKGKAEQALHVHSTALPPGLSSHTSESPGRIFASFDLAPDALDSSRIATPQHNPCRVLCIGQIKSILQKYQCKAFFPYT